MTFALEWAHEARKLLGDDEKFWTWFQTSFAQKVEKENQETDEPSFLRYKRGKTVVLHDFWKDGSSENAVQSQMLQWLSKAPEQLVDFLLLYVTHGVVLVGKPRTADELEQAEYKRLRGFLNFEAISLCLAWLNQNQEWLQALEKWKKTLLFQFSEKFVADASLVWSQSKGAGFFHAQTCPHARRIKEDNKATGSPSKSLRPHGYQAKALVEAQSVMETLSTIPSIGRQDY